MTKKVNLLPNKEPNLTDIVLGDYYVSNKLDGIRATTQGGQFLSRSLKPIPNARIQQKFQDILNTGYILDGELYEHGCTFQSITSRVMSHDKEPGGLKFYLFDVMVPGTFEYRQTICRMIADKYPNHIVHVEQSRVDNIDTAFDTALDNGYEGLILKHRDGQYKHGRSTLKEAAGFKVKPYETFTGKILSIIEQTEIKEGVQRTTNELGRSETSKKKGDRQLAGTASAFLVTYENTTVKVSLASMSHAERQEVWNQKATLTGKLVDYKGMLVGSKDVPRHPMFENYRSELDIS